MLVSAWRDNERLATEKEVRRVYYYAIGNDLTIYFEDPEKPSKYISGATTIVVESS